MTDYTTPPPPPPPPPPPGPPGGFPPPPPGGPYPPPPPGGNYPPPGGFPPPGGGYGGGGSPGQYNWMNITSLVLGIVSIVLCCCWAGLWSGIPAVVLGFLGMKRADSGLATNKTLGLVGAITGGVGLAIWLFSIIYWIATGGPAFDYNDFNTN